MADLAVLLDLRSVHLGQPSVDRDQAIRACGEALVAVGAATDAYVDAMLEREQSVSTYVGEGVAIPHGTLAGKEHVHHNALSFVSFPDGVDWGGERVTVGIGIAARDNGHIAILGQLATILMDPPRAAALRAATSADEVIALLTPDPEEDAEA
jgi:PTS system mannitol-specific IIA component